MKRQDAAVGGQTSRVWAELGKQERLAGKQLGVRWMQGKKKLRKSQEKNQRGEITGMMTDSMTDDTGKTKNNYFI